MTERDSGYINRIKTEAADTSLGQFTVSDLPALIGLMGLVDGITSVMHPSMLDAETVEKRIKQ